MNLKDKRKFTCFVCGVEYSDFEEYKSHIVTEHEEGRDYVLCPLDHCKAPIRDLKLHFKVKHPGQVMPKVGTQLKASIWKDQKGSKGTKTRKPKFRQGYYQSIKMQKCVKYRSGYECTVYECLDELMEVIAFEAEPFEISYLHQGEVRKYTPDILVSLTGGRVELWEIKPANQTNLEKNKDKWFAANEAAKLKGWKFKVITEKGIEKLKRQVRDQKINL